MKKHLWALAHTKRLFALLLFLLPGLTSFAQTWPPTGSPSIPEVISAGVLSQPTNPEWVNADMFTYYDGSDPYYLLAVVYDDYSGGSSKVHVAVYDSKTGITQETTIEDAKHPDVVLGHYVQTNPNDPPNVTAVVGVIYENLATNQPFINSYLVADAGLVTMSLTLSHNGALDWDGINPHIDIYPATNYLINGEPALIMFVATYEKNTPTGPQIFAAQHAINAPITFWVDPTTGIYDFNHKRIYIDDGIRPDVACATEPATANPIGYITYYKSDFSEIRSADIDPLSYAVTTYGSMENFVTFSGYPRIEAQNIQGLSATPWHVVAECSPEGGLGTEIHGYNNTGSINVADYGIPVGIPKDEFSPAVTIANGSATMSGSSTDVGNAGFTVGWNVDTRELQALYLDEANANTVNAGYNQVNTAGLGISGYGAGKSLFALTSSTNTGLGLAAAWFDGTDILAKITGNSFAFKPTIVNLTKQGKVNIHPNPATNQLFVSGLSKADYSITNVMGAQASNGNINGNSSVDISALPSGTYFINLSGDMLNEHIKFVKE